MDENQGVPYFRKPLYRTDFGHPLDYESSTFLKAVAATNSASPRACELRLNVSSIWKNPHKTWSLHLEPASHPVIQFPVWFSRKWFTACQYNDKALPIRSILLGTGPCNLQLWRFERAAVWTVALSLAPSTTLPHWPSCRPNGDVWKCEIWDFDRF